MAISALGYVCICMQQLVINVRESTHAVLSQSSTLVSGVMRQKYPETCPKKCIRVRLCILCLETKRYSRMCDFVREVRHCSVGRGQRYFYLARYTVKLRILNLNSLKCVLPYLRNFIGSLSTQFYYA